MVTTVIIDGEKFRFITQQYIVGLYVAVYKEGHSLPDQGSSRLKEADFHRKIRKSYPDFIKEESSILPEVVKKPRKRFRVIEHFNGYELEDIKTKRTHWLSDGVDVLSDEEGHSIPPGTEFFRKLWEEQFNSWIEGTLEAYFPPKKK